MKISLGQVKTNALEQANSTLVPKNFHFGVACFKTWWHSMYLTHEKKNNSVVLYKRGMCSAITTF